MASFPQVTLAVPTGVPAAGFHDPETEAAGEWPAVAAILRHRLLLAVGLPAMLIAAMLLLKSYENALCLLALYFGLQIDHRLNKRQEAVLF